MKKTKVKSKAYLIPMILIYLCILNTYYRRYHGTINIIKSEYESKIQLVEESILNEAKYTEIIASIAERDIQSKMEYNSNYLLGMYEDNPNVMEWNFTDLKDEFEKMDIYIIDENLNVVGSSSKEEVGLNLAYSNEFADSLKEILDGKEFRSDTINFSIMDNELKKYSYMPTPDNKYLIEFSVTINKVYPELGALNLVYLSKDLEKNIHL